MEDDGYVEVQPPVEKKPEAKPRMEKKPAKAPKTKHHMVRDEYTFTVKPKKAIHLLLVLLLLTVVFLAGRFTAPMDDGQMLITGLFVHEGTAAEPEEGVTEAEVEEISAEPEVKETAAKVPAEAAPPAEPVKEVVKEEPQKDEPVVTTYAHVNVALEKVYVDWHDGWGKIKGVEFSLLNNEAGTVKPNYIEISLPDYEDRIKQSEMKDTQMTVTSGETLLADVAIDGGYSYSNTVVDTQNAMFTLAVFDAQGNLMASLHQAVNLEE